MTELSNTQAVFLLNMGDKGGEELEPYANAAERVLVENIRQLVKWGDQSMRPPQEWFLIEGEEIAEVAQATNELYFGRVSDEQVAIAHLIEEWVQVSAVALAAVVALTKQAEIMGYAVET